jgi:hypothetical protein
LITIETRVSDILGKSWGDIYTVRNIVNYGAGLSEDKEEIVIPVCEKYFISLTVSNPVNCLPPGDQHYEATIFEPKYYEETVYIYNFDACDVLRRRMPECISGEIIEYKCETLKEINNFYDIVCSSLGVPGFAMTSVATVVEPRYGGDCKICGMHDPYPEQDDKGNILCWRCCG